MPPRVVWALLVIKDFFCTCPPNVGCDPSQGILSRKKAYGSKGDCKGFFRIVKGRLKMAFLHFKCKHLGLVSFAFFYVNMKNGFSLFMQ
jgi:hypothetical protein